MTERPQRFASLQGWIRRRGPGTLPSLLRLLLVALAFTFAAQTSVASAWCQARDRVSGVGGCVQPCIEEGLALHWTRPCIDYTVHESGARDLDDVLVFGVLDRSFASWTSIDCGGRGLGFDVQRRGERTRWEGPAYVSGEGNTNQFEFVDEEWSERGHSAGAFALTTTWFSLSDGTILDADMEINEQHWGWAVCPDAGCTDGNVDLENTITHELGHFFGLAHTPDDEDATMWACADEGETLKRTLETDDAEGGCAIYPEGALEGTCSFEPRGGFARFPGDDGCGCRAPGTGGSTAPLGFAIALLALVIHRRRRRP